MRKVAAVIGGGSGIGRQASLALSREGYAVAIVGRHVENLEETAALSHAAHEMLLTYAVDATQGDAVAAMFADIVSRWGRVDVLVNSAGSWVASTRVEVVPVHEWEMSIAVNLTSAFLCTRAAFAVMVDQAPSGGRIVFCGSVSSIVPRIYGSAYAAAKHGVAGLAKAVALDGRECKVLCTHLSLGNVSTEIGVRASKAGTMLGASIEPEPTFSPQFVGECIAWLAKLPLSVDVPSLTMVASGMPLFGRG